jgi:hypothetical protein
VEFKLLIEEDDGSCPMDGAPVMISMLMETRVQWSNSQLESLRTFLEA